MRAPSAAPVDPAESVQSPESELEKQALRERIAQRRQDDLVRRREFNYLRQVRAMRPQDLGALPRPSLFSNSSGFSHEEQSPQQRERTVRKIDAIEAHMAQNWAQGQRTAQVPLSATPAAAAPSPARPPLPPVAPAVVDALDADMDLDFTGLLSAPAEAVVSVSVPAPAAATTAQLDTQPSDFPSSLSFSNSRLSSVELGGELGNPALQDAAIRYAESDDSGAEATLLAVVQASDADPEQAQACAAALLDMYRATDQPASFEVVAIEYAQRFGRSAPEWFSVPDRLRRHAVPAAQGADVASLAASAWECPPLLDLAAVQALRDAQTQAQARHVRWDSLRSVQADAVAALAQLFTQWASLPLDLHFSGEAVLNQVLEAATPAEDRSTDPQCWHLRLEALRIQGQHEAFEAVALDYCVVYEVSPPSWLEADCTFVHESQATSSAAVAGPDSVISTLDDAATPIPLELRGELLGDASATLQQLQSQWRRGEPLVISCAHLIRVDFAAAGSLLNWLTSLQAQTGPVEMVQVAHLVAAFFQVMGIARVAVISTAKK